MFKMYLFVMCATLFMSGLNCSKFIKKRVTVLEKKVSAINSEMSLWQMDYQDVKSNLTQLLQCPNDNDCQDTTESDSYKVEVKGNTKTSEVDPGFYPRLLEAFKAEKKQRLDLKKSLLGKLELQQKQQHSLLEELSNKQSYLHEELSTVKQKLADTESRLNLCASDKGVHDLSNSMLLVQSKLFDCETKTTKLEGILYETVKTCTSDVATIKQDVKKDNLQLENKIHELAQTLANNKVSFSARLGRNIDNLQSYETVVFDVIINNNGEAYNPSTGVFTAPIHGVYVFFTHIMGAVRVMEMYIKKNGAGVAWLYSSGIGYGRDSNMIVLELLKGDTVYVAKHGRFGQQPFYVHHVWTTFSGFLLFSK